MILTIDTNEALTPKQKVAIAALLHFPGTDGVLPEPSTDAYAAQLATGEDTSAEKPKATRARRTKAQVAADKAAAEAEEEATAAPADEPTPDSENAESEQETTPKTKYDDKAQIEKLVEVATKLATSNRNALIEILGNHGVKRASQIPADERDAVIAEIETALSA